VILFWWPRGVEGAAPSSASATNTPAGVYRGADGSRAVLAPMGGKGTAWAMKFDSPSDSSMVMYLDGDAEEMKPVGVDVTARYNGVPLDISIGGSHIYARTKAGDVPVEIRGDGKKGCEFRLRGRHGDAGEQAKLSDSTANELNMLMGEYLSVWRNMQRSRIECRDGELRVSHPTRPAPSILKRVDDLGEEDQRALAGYFERHRRVLSRGNAAKGEEAAASGGAAGIR